MNKNKIIKEAISLIKIVFIISFFIIADSCKNCKEPYSLYLSAFKLKNQQVDSISKVILYFYSNNSNFNQPLDSLGVNKRQSKNDVELEFYRKSDTLKTFNYQITFSNKSIQEYKIRLFNDLCENCGDCDEHIHPQTIEINGVSKSNKGNIIDLN